jgi:N-acetylglucosaminyl-diphospho-decaprenol L-rhamnosyltransferase
MTSLVRVIVLNYNGRRWLPGCLEGLAGQRNAPAFDVLLVDNGSTDGSGPFVREHYPQVSVLETGANLGFAAGNNAGARNARGEWLAFLNNDTVPDPGWLNQLFSAAATHPDYDLITSRIVWLDDPSVLDSAGDGYLRAGGAFKRGHGQPAIGFTASEEVFGACGAAFVIRRALFERLGGFDESFFMVYEDVDLSYRARLTGARVWFAADAIVRHAGSATLGRGSAASVFHGQRNLECTWLKNTPPALMVRTVLPHMGYSLAGLAYYARRGYLVPAIRGKLSALAALPRIARARRSVQRGRRASTADLVRWMERGWIALKRREKSAAARTNT